MLDYAADVRKELGLPEQEGLFLFIVLCFDRQRIRLAPKQFEIVHPWPSFSGASEPDSV